MFKVELLVKKMSGVAAEISSKIETLVVSTNVLEIQRILPEVTPDDIERLELVAMASKDSQSEMNRLLAAVSPR